MFVIDALKKYAQTDRIALINREDTLSYRQMNELSDAFAVWLLDKFGDDRTPVLIYGHKETMILPCIYGSLKAGRAYVPIDITVPADRAMKIAGEVCPKVIVDFRGIGFSSEKSLILDGQALSGILDEHMGKTPDADEVVRGNDYSYILFTSGSTGNPKGVPITAANIENLAREFTKWVVPKGQIILNQISYSFDVSVVSVYIGVSLGLTLYTVDKGMVENLGQLFEHLGSSELAVWVSTPSFAEMCTPSSKFDSVLLPKIEKFIFCGEVLTHKLVDQLNERFPNAQVINTYGPTEATVLVTAVEIDKAMASDSLQIPIGKPLDEVTFRIVGEDGNALDSGEQGELLIISDNVGPGYYKRPDLTEKVFFTDISGKRGYHTGDSCFEKNGLYYYCGRMDNQLKLNGFRVEIEDVENNLVKVENIARAAVLPVSDEEKVSHLAAFVLLEHEDGLTPLKRSVKIKNALQEFLPSYMVPRKISVVSSFPLNTNGKIDKKALAKLL